MKERTKPLLIFSRKNVELISPIAQRSRSSLRAGRSSEAWRFFEDKIRRGHPFLHEARGSDPSPPGPPRTLPRETVGGRVRRLRSTPAPPPLHHSGRAIRGSRHCASCLRRE